MKSMPTFVFAAALAIGACGGSQKPKDTLGDDDDDEVAQSLSADECNSMVDHLATLSEDLDRDAALSECSEAGTRAMFDCVMAAEDQSALDTCKGEPPIEEETEDVTNKTDVTDDETDETDETDDSDDSGDPDSEG